MDRSGPTVITCGHTICLECYHRRLNIYREKDIYTCDICSLVKPQIFDEQLCNYSLVHYLKEFVKVDTNVIPSSRLPVLQNLEIAYFKPITESNHIQRIAKWYCDYVSKLSTYKVSSAHCSKKALEQFGIGSDLASIMKTVFIRKMIHELGLKWNFNEKLPENLDKLNSVRKQISNASEEFLRTIEADNILENSLLSNFSVGSTTLEASREFFLELIRLPHVNVYVSWTEDGVDLYSKICLENFQLRIKTFTTEPPQERFSQLTKIMKYDPSKVSNVRNVYLTFAKDSKLPLTDDNLITIKVCFYKFDTSYQTMDLFLGYQKRCYKGIDVKVTDKAISFTHYLEYGKDRRFRRNYRPVEIVAEDLHEAKEHKAKRAFPNAGSIVVDKDDRITQFRILKLPEEEIAPRVIGYVCHRDTLLLDYIQNGRQRLLDCEVVMYPDVSL